MLRRELAFDPGQRRFRHRLVGGVVDAGHFASGVDVPDVPEEEDGGDVAGLLDSGPTPGGKEDEEEV